MDIAWSYRLTWNDPTLGGSPGFLTSDPLPPGSNVYTAIALSRHDVDESTDSFSGGTAWSFIYEWTVHTSDGRTHKVSPRTWSNAEFIDNVHTITYALYVRRGSGVAQINVFTR